MTFKPMSLCEHANESPRPECNCPPDCGCMEFMCRVPRPAFDKRDVIQAVKDCAGVIMDILAGNTGLAEDQRRRLAGAMVDAGIAAVLSPRRRPHD